MSKTVRKFRGKAYRQGHEPCELELERKRAKKLAKFLQSEHFDKAMQEALKEAAALEQEEMGYGKQQ